MLLFFEKVLNGYASGPLFQSHNTEDFHFILVLDRAVASNSAYEVPKVENSSIIRKMLLVEQRGLHVVYFPMGAHRNEFSV